MTTKYANTPTPLPSLTWTHLIPPYRKPITEHALDEYKHIVQVVDAKENGHIILRLIEPLSAIERGELLLEIERTFLIKPCEARSYAP